MREHWPEASSRLTGADGGCFLAPLGHSPTVQAAGQEARVGPDWSVGWKVLCKEGMGSTFCPVGRAGPHFRENIRGSPGLSCSWEE